MAFRILRNLPRVTSRQKQALNYLLVTDFEATCDERGLTDPPEIIELPCAALCTRDWEVRDTFHQYIKPSLHTELSPFCTDLTGIYPEMLHTEPHFPEAFARFQQWLKRGGYFEGDTESAFVTCGNMDLQVMLPMQCAIHEIPIPQEFKRWVNLKTAYSLATSYYPRSMVDMLSRLSLPAEKPLHSGIKDVKNMVKIIRELQQRYSNFVFEITNEYQEVELKSISRYLANRAAMTRGSKEC